MGSEPLSLNFSAPLLPALKEADLSRVFIGLGASIDPDGLASQLAMEKIIKSINPDAEVFLFYRGDWDRAQNRTMREVLGFNPRPYDEAEIVNVGSFNYTTLIMVDGNIEAMPLGIPPHFVIDHHEGVPGALTGSDVRLIGSCSAIMWEYIMATDPELLEGEEGAILATALAIGIATDTVDKTVPKTSELDWKAEAYCGVRCDIKAYAAIKNYQKPAYQKDMEMKAWKDKDHEGTVLTTPLGVIPRERKGVISSCAEEFCGQGPYTTTLAAGMINGDVYFSVRTFKPSVNVDTFIKNSLTPTGGGKPGAGAGVIRMPDVCKNAPKEIQQEIFTAMYKAVSHETFKYMNDGVRSEDEESSDGAK